MGSSGNDNFGAYKPREDVCPKEIVFDIEDIDQSDYYLEKKSLPKVDSDVFIANTLVNKRLVVVDFDSKLVLGNVPVSYNYIFTSCIEKGKQYLGLVKYTTEEPYNKIMVELHVK